MTSVKRLKPAKEWWTLILFNQKETEYFLGTQRNKFYRALNRQSRQDFATANKSRTSSWYPLLSLIEQEGKYCDSIEWFSKEGKFMAVFDDKTC